MKKGRRPMRIGRVEVVSVLMVACVLLAASSATAQPGGWPMFRYDDARTGNTPLTSNITEPALKRIRRFMPRMQLDLSPIVLIVGLYFVQYSIIWVYVRLAG